MRRLKRRTDRRIGGGENRSATLALELNDLDLARDLVC